MAPGELEPPVPLAGKRARNLQDQCRARRHLPVLVAAKGLEAGNIPGRDEGLMKEPIQLLEPFDAVALFARHPLTFPANVNAMATPVEALIRTRPTADSAIMSHALRECSFAVVAATIPQFRLNNKVCHNGDDTATSQIFDPAQHGRAIG